MKQFFVEHPKLKNPYFYLSIVALIFSASGVDFNQLTQSQYEELMQMLEA